MLQSPATLALNLKESCARSERRTVPKLHCTGERFTPLTSRNSLVLT